MALQTLDRAMAALRLVAGSSDGLRLTVVQRALGLSKPTTHRLLAALVEHDLVKQDEASRLYRLGPGLQTLRSLQSTTVPDLKSVCMPSVYALAESSGDTVFLVARDRAETVCLARESGSYPIRAITIEVGTWRPLGLGAGGLAILGALPADECRRLVDALAPRINAMPNTSVANVLKATDNARQAGFSISDEQVAKGVRGISVCIRDTAHSPMAAIGIAAIRERLRPERIRELVGHIRHEVARVEQRLADLST